MICSIQILRRKVKPGWQNFLLRQKSPKCATHSLMIYITAHQTTSQPSQWTGKHASLILSSVTSTCVNFWSKMTVILYFCKQHAALKNATKKWKTVQLWSPFFWSYSFVQSVWNSRTTILYRTVYSCLEFCKKKVYASVLLHHLKPNVYTCLKIKKTVPQSRYKYQK